MAMLEKDFVRLLEILARINPPKWFDLRLKSLISTQAKRWLKSRGIKEELIVSAAWTLYLIAMVSLFWFSFLFIFFVDGITIIFIILAGLIFGFILTIYPVQIVNNFVMREEKSIFRDAPSVVACISMSMRFRPSIEQAVQYTATQIHSPLSEKLSQSIWSVFTRKKRNIILCLEDIASSFSDLNNGIQHAFHLIVASSYESTREGLNRLLDKANSLVINNVRDRVENFVATLAMPTMVLFALGIILPIMILSFFPLTLLQMDSLVASANNVENIPMQPPWEAYFLILVIIPTATFLYARSILLQNPISTVHHSDETLKKIDHAIFVVPSVIILLILGCILYREPYLFLIIFSIPVPLLLAFGLRRNQIQSRKSSDAERDFITALYEIGNHMIAGESFETSLKRSYETRHATFYGDFAKRVLRRSQILKTKIETIISEEMDKSSLSAIVKSAYYLVAKCALRDTTGAGLVALNLAQNLSDIRSLEMRIIERLGSIIDMMKYTCILFAPLVLGITSSIFVIPDCLEPSSNYLFGSNTLVVGLYLLELTFIITYFSDFLLPERKCSDVIYHFGTRMPFSMIVFIFSSIISKTWIVHFF
ncbi:MAG: hypothetical protein QW083_03150 [Methanomassiliicoccales archaeon]